MHRLLRHLGAAAPLAALLACDPPDDLEPRVGAPPNCECWALCQDPVAIEEIVVPITLESGQACEVHATTRGLVDAACDDRAIANGGNRGKIVGDEPRYQCASE
jgi:hypothetical protein